MLSPSFLITAGTLSLSYIDFLISLNSGIKAKSSALYILQSSDLEPAKGDFNASTKTILFDNHNKADWGEERERREGRGRG